MVAVAAGATPLRAGRVGALAIVGALTVACGGVLATKVVMGPRDAHLAHVAQPVEVSFGYVAVSRVDELPGLSHEQAPGAAHGTPGYVDSDHVQLQVSLEMVSEEVTEAKHYDPAQFRLALDDKGSTVRIAPTSSTLTPGELLPRAAIQGRLGFVVPVGATHLRLELPDEGRIARWDLDHRVALGPSETGVHHP